MMGTMWRHISQSVVGPAHAVEGGFCQDCRSVQIFGTGTTSSLLACIADGAGSAKHGGIGAQIACRSILEYASAYFEIHHSFTGLDTSVVLQWCENIRHRLEREAANRRSFTRAFATTLCAAIIAPDHATFFQVGDGAIVLSNRGVLGVVFWPQSGEYANSTNFLTAGDFAEHLEFLSVPAKITDVALLTDGLERLALSFENQVPHPPFFRPLFDALHTNGDVDALSEALSLFLQSESVRARSDDDKTLVLASRRRD
jgi:hypothetical protein